MHNDEDGLETQCNGWQMEFHGLGSRRVVGRFDGGRISSDGGSVLLREVESRTHILKRLAGCFIDHRDLGLIEHSVESLIKQRVYGMALGYEDLDWEAMDKLLVELFLDSYGVPPQEMVIDMDATDDPLHGHQEGRFFHGYYGHYCYLPLYFFCGDKLLGARLREADEDPAGGVARGADHSARFLPRGDHALM